MVLILVMVVVSFSRVDMFDTVGTLPGTAKQARMLDEIGSSTATVFVESSTGIAEGGRTGM